MSILRKASRGEIIPLLLTMLVVTALLVRPTLADDAADKARAAEKAKRAEKAAAAEKEAELNAEARAATKKAARAADDKLKWESLFDGKTMGGWKLTEFGTSADVEIEDGHMLLPLGEGCAGVTWQKEFPKVDYEVRLEAQRVEGSDFFCGMTFPVGEQPCSLIIGGWGGAVVGLSSIDGKDAARNETTKYMKFKKGQWYDVKLRVTGEKITAWIDGQQVVDVTHTGHKLTIRPEVELSRPFGICSFSTRAALRGIEIRNLEPAPKAD